MVIVTSGGIEVTRELFIVWRKKASSFSRTKSATIERVIHRVSLVTRANVKVVFNGI